jgi:hypothetical protein
VRLAAATHAVSLHRLACLDDSRAKKNAGPRALQTVHGRALRWPASLPKDPVMGSVRTIRDRSRASQCNACARARVEARIEPSRTLTAQRSIDAHGKGANVCSLGEHDAAQKGVRNVLERQKPVA